MEINGGHEVDLAGGQSLGRQGIDDHGLKDGRFLKRPWQVQFLGGSKTTPEGEQPAASEALQRP